MAASASRGPRHSAPRPWLFSGSRAGPWARPWWSPFHCSSGSSRRCSWRCAGSPGPTC